jgi:hypothetical protein
MLLVEYNVLEKVQVITEGKGKNQRKKLRGKFQKCDEQNNNGRVYPRKILENQVKAIKEKIDDRSLVGALDHPSNDAIHLSQASHLITNLWVEKNGDVMGECEILSTPNGKIVEALLNDGVKIGISSRGLGSVSEGTNGKVVNEDFKLITFDLVSDPSTKGAFPAMSESMRENSQRAQEIVSKHKKDRVLLTMLESKIRDSLTEAVVGLSPAAQRQNDVNNAVKTANKRGNRPQAARLRGIQSKELAAGKKRADKIKADKAAIDARQQDNRQQELPFTAQTKRGKFKDIDIDNQEAALRRGGSEDLSGLGKRESELFRDAVVNKLKDIYEANVHDKKDTSNLRIQRRAAVVRGRQKDADQMSNNMSVEDALGDSAGSQGARASFEYLKGRQRQATGKAAKDHAKAMNARMAGRQRDRGESPK